MSKFKRSWGLLPCSLRVVTLSLMVGCLPAAQIGSAETPRQGEYGELSKWHEYTYEIKTSYPYVKALPTPDKIPQIINLLEQHEEGGGALESQLSCLTRMSFDRYHADNSPFDSPRAWRQWWGSVGKDYFERVETEGRHNPAAWKLLVGDAQIPCPGYKILIPQEWHFEIRFRSGDYGGVEREVIRMERTQDAATLKRHCSVDSTTPFQYEVWHGFTPQEADRFLYALAYAIDQPWFVKQFISIPRKKSKSDSAFTEQSHPGRNWGDYYSRTEWSGVLLSDGRVWWNDNPWLWHSTRKRKKSEEAPLYVEKISLDVGCRLVYPFICHNYPEKRSIAGSAGWKPDPNPPPLKDRPKNDWDK